nr:unnamed protein product [Digitaria exilis]
MYCKAYYTEYLYPLLNTTSNARSFEYLCLTTLGVLGALVKVDDTEVVTSLLNSQFIPVCLQIMETGNELSKTVSTFIVQKIILNEAGLQYICATPERFYGIASVLASMVAEQPQPSTRLLKQIVRCYLRLSDDPRACSALQTHLPEVLTDGTFNSCLRVSLSLDSSIVPNSTRATCNNCWIIWLRLQAEHLLQVQLLLLLVGHILA